MMAEILLDFQGDLPAPLGVRVIESEVDFLRYATSGQSLLIRGEQLCRWAQDFYALRGLTIKILESPRKALQCAFPALSPEQAHELASKIGQGRLAREELSAAFVLSACFPDDYALWQGGPSSQHAARWLLWLVEHNPSEAERVILQAFASEMSNQAGGMPISEAYSAQDSAQARTLLFRWLGAEQPNLSDWGEFPLELSPAVLNQVKEAWKERIIASNGSFFAEMLAFPLPLALRQELARLIVQYYRSNPHQLNRLAFQQLSSYLESESLDALFEVLPPPTPSSLPEEENAVLEWFERQYLPYRRWQAKFGDESARQIAVQHAQTFAYWLLKRYPYWLLEGEHLAFQKAAHLSDASALTLCIVLDGLPAWDAEWLVHELSARISRLTLLQKNYSFSALPTVTEFAKESLLRGAPPIYASQISPLGNILPDNRSPHKSLSGACAGQVWFWCVEQPDKAYHFEQEDKRERRVRAELQAVIEEVQQVVQAIPDTVCLKILLTSDHGRLMNSRSRRQLPRTGMQPHGRAAWGKIERVFPESGFFVDEENGWVELFGERFSVQFDLCLAWGEESFSSIGGIEAYPHGGLFPEEVIVPWFVFERDAKVSDPKICVTGVGEADMSGEVEIEILNPNPFVLECIKINFTHGAEILLSDWKIAPFSKFSGKLMLHPWPNKSNVLDVAAKFLFVQPSGKTFVAHVVPALDVKTLYERSDDLLKDLSL